MMKKNLIFLAVFLLPIISAADTTSVFLLSDFYKQILLYHPVARQAELLSEEAQQEIRLSRGNFDPKLISKFYEKEFKGSHYFTTWDNALKIPTWFGIDIKAGFEKNTGEYVNRESVTPGNGLSYIGVSIPIGQGLIIDQRRATLQQAKLLARMAEASKVSMINKLLLEASKDYWDWAFYFQQWQLYNYGYDLAILRFNGVKERAEQGDLPAIDTIEAKIQMQTRAVMLKQAKLEYQNASLILSNHLWTTSDTPVEITDDVIPPDDISAEMNLPQDSIDHLMDMAKKNHPDLIKIAVKQEQLDIERRYLADKFKPKLNLEYNLLQQGFPVDEVAFDGAYYTNNYKFGFSFEYPIFLRQERGKFQLNKLKRISTDFDQQQQGREIINEIQSHYNTMLFLQEQIELQEEMLVNAIALRNGEQSLFENGESSLFLINSREMNLISSQIKLFELKTKYAKAKANLAWAAGISNLF